MDRSIVSNTLRPDNDFFQRNRPSSKYLYYALQMYFINKFGVKVAMKSLLQWTSAYDKNRDLMP